MTRPHHIADSSKKFPITDGFQFAPRGLNIVWGSDPRYWNIPEDDSPAGLIQVSWLEVSGSLPIVQGKTYKISFNVSLKPDSFGWDGSQVLVMAKVGEKGTYEFKEASLSQTGEIITIPTDPLVIQVPSNAEDLQLHFGLYEVWSGKWKGGLEIHNATIQTVPDECSL